MAKVAPIDRRGLGLSVEGPAASVLKTTILQTDAGSDASDISDASQVKHTPQNMSMGFYKVDLSTKIGQRLHSAHMVVLPLIPIMILIMQNGFKYGTFVWQAADILRVQGQVIDAVGLSTLIHKIQDERAAVALNIFLNRPATDDLSDLQPYVGRKVELKRFILVNTFQSTDNALTAVTKWPKIGNVDYFKTKLTFQIQHSIFRTKIREGEKSIFQVLDWYNEIVAFFIDYLSRSIHDSESSDVYRFIIGFKNLLKAVEYSGKSGIYGLRYLSQGEIENRYYLDFVRYEVLRKDYLNQTFNFMEQFRATYLNATQDQYYEHAQEIISKRESYSRVRAGVNDTVFASIDYFSSLVEYMGTTKNIIDQLTEAIEDFVSVELKTFEDKRTIPFAIFVPLIIFVPIVVYITLHTTMTMIKYTVIYNERCVVYANEKKKTEQLLTALLPKPIIGQLKRGQVPVPASFSSMSVLLSDIVSFTNLASESTANQIVDLLNDLYNQFDDICETLDVYKVETIGDAYLVASGVPEPHDNHAGEVCKLGLEMMRKIVTFEVKHKPGYRMRIRIGVDSGSAAAGVVGDKIPHYSIFGETVETAGLMEQTSEPMKIQISENTKYLLERDGTFNFIERESPPEKLDGVQTYWLVGRSHEGADGAAQPNGEA